MYIFSTTVQRVNTNLYLALLNSKNVFVDIE